MTRIAILHFAGPPTVGGVEWTMLQHARLMADAGYAVRIMAGTGKPFDDRVEVVVVPELGSRHPDVLAVKKELDAGRVTPQFDALRDRMTARLRELLADVDILIAHNVFTLHKNLALTAALSQLISDHGSRRYLGWHHDFAWTNPLYRDQLHDGEPWDLLRRPWPNAAGPGRRPGTSSAPSCRAWSPTTRRHPSSGDAWRPWSEVCAGTAAGESG